MPWLSIAVWLITFLLSSSKEGVSKGKAALLATGAALGTYYLADPSNPDNLLGFGQDAKAEPGDPAEEGLATDEQARDATKAASVRLPTIGTTIVTETGETVRELGTAAISEVGNTARSFGPVGTLGVVAGTSVISDGSSWLKDNLWLVLGGVAVFMLLKS